MYTCQNCKIYNHQEPFQIGLERTKHKNVFPEEIYKKRACMHTCQNLCAAIQCNRLQYTTKHCKTRMHTCPVYARQSPNPIKTTINHSKQTQQKETCWNQFHRKTMGLEGGGYLYHTMTPPINFGRFGGVVLNFAFYKVVPPWIWTKLFRHGDAKVGGKGRATRWGCRMTQNWLQEPIEGTWQSLWTSACTDLHQLCPPHLVRSSYLRGLSCS